MTLTHLMLAIAEGFGESPAAHLLQPDADPERLLADPPAPPDVPPSVAARLRAPDLRARAEALLRRCRDVDQTVLTPHHEHWPRRFDRQRLRPLVLFARGDVTAASQAPAVAVVGSRTPTPYGIGCTDELAAALVYAGAVLWSGLARGVDALAHEAALAAHRPTVAVLAGGLDVVYPSEHVGLAQRIVAHGGCLLSELPPGRRARRGHFVRRNRLLAAGAHAVLVVEGSLLSGALHTARFAAEGDTEVLAVPGPMHSPRSQGPHRLIQEGAAIVEGPQAMLQALGLAADDPATSLRLERSASQRAVLELLANGPRPADLMRRESGLDEAQFLRALFELQRAGDIARQPGDLWRRCARRPTVDAAGDSAGDPATSR